MYWRQLSWVLRFLRLLKSEVRVAWAVWMAWLPWRICAVVPKTKRNLLKVKDLWWNGTIQYACAQVVQSNDRIN